MQVSGAGCRCQGCSSAVVIPSSTDDAYFDQLTNTIIKALAP
ncbi:hypothetical protein VSH64_31380 [Amycolatopsis rhabdoformis]|uniref:Uncharacterized protein n=1 Tax=Amycolatopsis rhabdoformis TaxID=1448059 RepID=A0ABZ1I115_9PSEU|nr:hypothetical protein [Amycolatopsis rhabdoformis]WSE27349.1 hypothetical protein VSH64_31380 [Amycolatopsis rhabdoformis]